MSVHGGGGGVPDQVNPPGTRYTPPDQVHPPRYGHCCGRYASYWNAFLFDCYTVGHLWEKVRTPELLLHARSCKILTKISFDLL